jgi:hypothetical protein
LTIPKGNYVTVLFFTRKFGTGNLQKGYRCPLGPIS